MKRKLFQFLASTFDAMLASAIRLFSIIDFMEFILSFSVLTHIVHECRICGRTFRMEKWAQTHSMRVIGAKQLRRAFMWRIGYLFHAHAANNNHSIVSSILLHIRQRAISSELELAWLRSLSCTQRTEMEIRKFIERNEHTIGTNDYA